MEASIDGFGPLSIGRAIESGWDWRLSGAFQSVVKNQRFNVAASSENWDISGLWVAIVDDDKKLAS